MPVVWWWCLPGLLLFLLHLEPLRLERLHGLARLLLAPLALLLLERRRLLGRQARRFRRSLQLLKLASLVLQRLQLRLQLLGQRARLRQLYNNTCASMTSTNRR